MEYDAAATHSIKSGISDVLRLRKKLTGIEVYNFHQEFYSITLNRASISEIQFVQNLN